ncbi:hypothetical protein [Leptolyngbya sp. O-77]|uniref:hypothetical protein n=1 Tax=Leptolyngbya sp. O-77 TaxID=1080068 RepID=UPI000B3016C1|nr:hypothetical protein [Leptolyngbya sp. O-77]
MIFPGEQHFRQGVSLGRSPFISQHPHLSAIAPRYLSEPQTADPNLSPLNVGILPESCWDWLQ